MGKNEVGGHIARIGRGEVHKGFWCGDLRERNHLEDPDVDGRIIRRIYKLWEGGGGGMNWTNLTQDRDRWRALVNAVMNFRVQYNAGNFLIS
jgi:hypothetical protein